MIWVFMLMYCVSRLPTKNDTLVGGVPFFSVRCFFMTLLKYDASIILCTEVELKLFVDLEIFDLISNNIN